jgi:hypothetical protein
MRSLRLSLAILVVIAGAGHTQTGGRVELYPDAAMSSCSLVDDQAGVIQVHMFHTNMDYARSVVFAAPTPDCWSEATWLGDMVAFDVNLGNTHDTHYGLAIGYSACVELPIYLGYMNYATSGTAEQCCVYRVIAATGTPSGEIEVSDCNLQMHYGVGGELVINPNENCLCEFPVPTQSSTWGKIKVLYLD